MPFPRATVAISLMAVGLLVLGVPPEPAGAQVDGLRFDTPPVMLSQSIVSALAQDRHGFVWIGTQGGLVRFDGHTPLVYSATPGSARALPSSAVRDVLEHSDGRLWIATLSGLAILSADRDTLRSFTGETHPEVFPLSDAMNRMAELPDGRVAAGTAGGGLVVFRADGHGARVFLNDPDDPTSLPNNTVEAVAVAPDGALWVATQGGLVRQTPDTGIFESVPLPPSPAGLGRDQPRRLAFDSAGILWVGGLDAVIRVDPATGAARRVELGPSRIQSLLASHPDSIWVGTYGSGLFLLNRDGRVRLRNQASGERPQALLDDRVSALIRDRTGLLWVGLLGRGIQTADPRGTAFQQVVFGRGLEEVTDVAAHPDGRGTVVTTYEGGVHLVAPDGRIVQRIAVGRPSVPGEPAEALSSDWGPDGTLLVGTMRLGVQQVLPDGGLRTFLPIPGDTLSLPNAAVYAITRDTYGRIWVGTGLGLRRFDVAAGTFHPPAVDDSTRALRNAFVRSLRLAPDGSLWVATLGEGLVVLHPDGGPVTRIRAADHPTLRDDEVASVAFQGGYAWFGTRSMGTLHRVSGWQEGETLRVDPVGPAEGMGGSIQCIVADRQGQVWASSPNGILTVDPATLAVTTFGPADGLPAGEYRTASCGLGPTGRVWFGQQTGVTVFDPRTVERPRAEGVTAVSLATVGDREMVAPFGPTVPSIPYRGSSVTFRLSVLDYRSPEDQAFSYRLDDGAWSPLDDQASVTFAQLPPGSYAFQARGRDAHGFLTEPTQPFRFRVDPPYYMTGWFRALILVLIAGILFGLYQWRTRTILRHNAALRTEIDERKRIEAQRAALEEQLRHAQKMEAVGRLTGGIAHDFNNILTVLMGNTELLLETVQEPDRRGLLEEIHRSGGVASRLVRQLMVFSRRQPLTPTPTDLRNLLLRMAPLLRRTLGDQIEVVVHTGEERAEAVIDANQMEAALLNLAINARDAMPDGGRLDLHVELLYIDEPTEDGVPPGRWVVVTARDTGSGIHPDILDRIFEPFFTTKGVGEGSGLGLAMVYGFVDQSGGHLRVSSRPAEGATFTIYLPAAEV